MDFDVKLKVDIAFSDEGMMLLLDMKLCEKIKKKKEEEEDPNSQNLVKKKKKRGATDL